MGDIAERQITADTPGSPAVLNPFESPTDYHHLHEPLVRSPSVFKCSKASSATPAKFKWSIDEMSNLLPVHIDPEDIHRQALYLSQSRMDSEVEEKRQIAIEQFFTKGAIVPSPWGPPESKQSVQLHHKKSSLTPLVMEEPKKINATCQTVLSLPVDFDLEKVLGTHYRSEEVSEQVQESLSSSSLRRKLFLDGRSSGSESSAPPSPDRESPAGKATMSSLAIVSPLKCGIAAITPSSGQFSSSPIQDQCRAYSLGSVASPMFPERSSPVFKSPTVSPILQPPLTPLSGERKRLSFLSPDCLPSGNRSMAVNRCGESPYVEGCSPIHSCSPLHRRPRTGACTWASPAHISPILHPDDQDKEKVHSGEPLPSMDLDTCSPAPHTPHQGLRPGHRDGCNSLSDLERMEQGETVEGNVEVRMGKGRREAAEEVEEMAEFLPEDDPASPARLAGSRAGGASRAESTRMFVSLLTEGSLTPYDVSMQVDSGYNTNSTCATSLMDGISSESKELQEPHTAAEEGLGYTKHTKSKLVTPLH
ncbi:protein aurora borealis [Electrophorus electricus]|uniref:protein aurora borealis n=1 Tax=Electrophorus electricus TaxID=8005 RepID=UPI0015D06796|nr:protein aurora borealis [Electrophorus electricus]